MADITCNASGCNSNSSYGGKIFFQCDHCTRWWCSEHGYEGKRCPGCNTGVLQK